MQNELRYQAKMHIISEKLSKEKLKFYILSPFFFLMLKIIKQKNNKDILMEKEITSSPSM
jgi:hypothetical protein